MVHVVTCNPALPDIVMAALKTSAVAHAPSGAAFIEKIVRDFVQREDCVLIDLATIPDGERLISFIRTSPSPTIWHLPLVALGTPENFETLPEHVSGCLNGVLAASYTAGELAAVIASVCEE